VEREKENQRSEGQDPMYREKRGEELRRKTGKGGFAYGKKTWVLMQKRVGGPS